MLPAEVVMRSLGIACIIAMIGWEVTPMSTGETALDGYRWQNRLLLVFAPDADSALYRRQQEMLLVAECGLNERDMVIIFVIRDAVSTKGGRRRQSRQSICGTPMAYCRMNSGSC